MHIDIDIISDRLIPAYTGKKSVSLNHGYNNGDNEHENTIIIKNESLHAMTVCALNLIGRVTGKK